MSKATLGGEGARAGVSEGRPPGRIPRPRAILFDRDGTLIHDVPYVNDPALVRPVDGAAELLDRVRAAGLSVGIVSNQSGVGRGLIQLDQLAAVNARVEALLGPFGTIQFCPHTPDEGCRCRKPQPGMVIAGAAALGVAPEECVVIGDIAADVEAARNAGGVGYLVPTPVTRAAEVEDARSRGVLHADLASAVEAVLAAAR